MSSGCKDKALAWEFIKFCIGQKQFEFEDANSDSYYRNFFTYGSMLNKENTRQLVAYQWKMMTTQQKNGKHTMKKFLQKLFGIYS